jgi:hypothetical protein
MEVVEDRLFVFGESRETDKASDVENTSVVANERLNLSVVPKIRQKHRLLSIRVSKFVKSRMRTKSDSQ